MSATIIEAEREIKVLTEADVLVAGAGVAGCAAGVASALAVRNNQPAAELDIRTIQKTLLQQNMYLGPPERLKELGLVI